MTADQERLDQIEQMWAVVREYLPQAIGFNTLPEIVAGIARQRDAQHEINDHLVDAARRLTDERDRLLSVVRDQAEQIAALQEARVKAYRSIHAAQLHAYDLLHESGATRMHDDTTRTPEQTALVVLYSLVHDAVKMLAGRTDIEYPDLQKVTELTGELRIGWAKSRADYLSEKARADALQERIDKALATMLRINPYPDRNIDMFRDVRAALADVPTEGELT